MHCLWKQLCSPLYHWWHWCGLWRQTKLVYILAPPLIEYMSLETHLSSLASLFIHHSNGLFMIQIIEPHNSPSLLILLPSVWAVRFWCLMSRIKASRGAWAVALGSISKKVCALAWDSMTKYHILGCLNSKFIFSRFWRLEVQDQSASMVSFWWRLSSWLVDGGFGSPHVAKYERERERMSKLSGVPS